MTAQSGAVAPPIHTILWRRLDRPGHEAARLYRQGDDWHLAGTAVFAHDGQPCRLGYFIVCDSGWRTVRATVSGWAGDRNVEIEIAVDEGRWRLNGAEQPQAAGCIDLDLNFSPSTNLLPIRRLNLAVGGEAPVRAAWLRFPSFALEPLEQTYLRLSGEVYRYQSAGGAFTADLQVNEAGLVTLYPGAWQAE
jgi:hypothetical protein